MIRRVLSKGDGLSAIAATRASLGTAADPRAPLGPTDRSL